MITNNELETIKLSPTKKDFYQIWNELLDLADKLSFRWSPSSTNEADPGVVLLKVLTAAADKLSYNIDKNILEAFMPTAAQVDSMRKLCDLMGYSMKYYRGATCKVTISYKNSNEDSISSYTSGIYFPKFVNLKDIDNEVNYVTLESFTLQEGITSRTVDAMEGELVECETDNDNIVTLNYLDDNHRYFLPETNIAENGVFIFNVKDNVESEEWAPTDNLNTEILGSRVFKFGYDSNQKLPFIQFPDDISNLIEDGLKIKYIRTNGITGNIAASTLTQLEVPALWATADEDVYGNISSLTADNFSVTNITAAVNGSNPESINSAYNNFKKTIGTFDTLVTCRDYMNKIYQLTMSDADTTPLVSNVVVSDIRDDINRAVKLCSFNDVGICYIDTSLKNGSSDVINKFDLLLYPFTTVRGLQTQSEYENSFKQDSSNVSLILSKIEENKSLAHNIITPADSGLAPSEIFCIKVYLRLNAKIITTRKVTYVEEQNIIDNVKTSIFTNFNARQVDLGEEISYNEILDTIKNADSLIKEVILDEPTTYAALCKINNKEVNLGDEELLSNNIASDDFTNINDEGKVFHNKLALRNVLAGRISAFNYNNEFANTYDETTPLYTSERGTVTVNPITGKDVFTPDGSAADSDEIYFGRPSTDYVPGSSALRNSFYVEKAISEVSIRSLNESENGKPFVLRENEIIQFKAPNLKTTFTYPAYVNYFIKLNVSDTSTENSAAVMKTIKTFLIEHKDWIANALQQDTIRINAEYFSTIRSFGSEDDESNISSDINDYGMVVYNGRVAGEEGWTSETQWKALSGSQRKPASEPSAGYYYVALDSSSFVQFLYDIVDKAKLASETAYYDRNFYRSNGGSVSNVPGYLIDSNRVKYSKVGSLSVSDTPINILTKYYVSNNLGETIELQGLPANADYTLKSGEYLLVNYTNSTTDDSGSENETVINKYYGPGTIIQPNFNLVDSTLYQGTHSFQKKSGYNFTELTVQPAGLFSLGSNEQICIRDFVKVELSNSECYLYWILKSDKSGQDNEFIFDETIEIDGVNYYEYTLKDDEYLFYTDSKKTNLAFYGKGTTIRKNINTPKLIKKKDIGEASADDIVSYGLTASIPWTQFNLSGTKSITVIENQFLTLTEGDMLYSLDVSNNITSKGLVYRNITIDNEWKNVKGACYKFADSDGYSYLPLIDVSTVEWKVRSILNFNVSSTTSQKLHNKNNGEILDTINVIFKKQDGSARTYLKFSPKWNVNEIETDAGDGKDYTTLSFYTNYPMQTSATAIDTTCTGYTNDGVKRSDLNNFRLKVIDQKSILCEDGSNLNLDNYGNSFTKFSFSGCSSTLDTNNTPVFTLNTSMSSSNGDLYGLLMVYYTDEEGTLGKTPAKLVVSGTNATIEQFNTSSTPSATYTLSLGINVLKISVGTTNIKIYSDSQKTSTIIISDLSIVKGINEKLCYFITNNNYDNALDQLLADIRATNISSKFYYNVPIENNKAIELNPYVTKDNLLNPRSFFDSNNVNNKFTISEIDADYLDTGITLTKSSKSY